MLFLKKIATSIENMLRKVVVASHPELSKLDNTYISEECGFVLQYVYEPEYSTYLRLLADTYPYCERSTKCSVPFVHKEPSGFAFGDIPRDLRAGVEPEGQKTHIVRGLIPVSTNGGGGMYNNAINQARITKALHEVAGLAVSKGKIHVPCVMPKADQASFIQQHKGIDIAFEFISGKPREAHIVSVDERGFYAYLQNVSKRESKRALKLLQTAGLNIEDIANMSYRNIHDKLPVISKTHDLKEEDLSAISSNTVVINNLAPGTRFRSIDAYKGEIEFRIGSNQLVELKDEIDNGETGQISQLVSASSIIFLNAEEAHKLFSMPYTGHHSQDVTYGLAKKIHDVFGVKDVVISDEGRPVTYFSKDRCVQVEIPDLDSTMSNELYTILGQTDLESRIQNPTGCGDTLAPALQIAKKIPALTSQEMQLQFSVFWASVVYRISGSNLKDLPDDIMRDLMAVCLDFKGCAEAA